MILVDKAGHLVSDTSMHELHEFATALGLKRDWFQNHSRHPHYDLITRQYRPNTRLIAKAVDMGAKLVSSKEIVKMFKNCFAFSEE